MRNRAPKNFTTPSRPSWRDYQSSLQRDTSAKRLIKSGLKYSVVLSLLLVAFYGIIWRVGPADGKHTRTKVDLLSAKKAATKQVYKKFLNKKEIQTVIDGKNFINRMDKNFDLVLDGRYCRVETSLHIPLQNFILKNMQRSTSRYIGIVAMEPSTGKVLLMAGFDKINPLSNPCIESKFPAASIFKIVTASAAIEKCDFNSNSTLKYNGNKYTLYKSQLKNRTNKYTNRITLRDSFAQSVNPVFGKIGSLYLGKSNLYKYATAFGFNRNIDFEISLSPSHVSLSDEPYQWAEIASGFNRETVISPLHGALLGSTILNRGNLVEPTIIEKISDETGQILYESRLKTINHAIDDRTSKVVKNLMNTTIRSGTCRKYFRKYRQDRILSKLNIGGKTGSISNKAHNIRYDWFVGFAEEKKGPQKIALSIVVGHEKYIGKRASQYARMAIKEYFRDYFAKNNVKKNTVHRS
jgi:peptidoglycan glycosyltransferase